MAGKNATPLIGWHSSDSTLKPWLEAEFKRRGMGTMRELLDEMAAEYREHVESLAPFQDAEAAETANREITDSLRVAARETTETGDPS